MTEQLEHELRHLFAEDAERAPAAVSLAEEARRRVRQRRRARYVMGAGALVAASVVVVALVASGVLADGQPSRSPVASPLSSSAPTPSPTTEERVGALPVPAGASCANSSPDVVARLTALSFDGTVVAVGPARQSERSDGYSRWITTTLDVHEWFHGGSDATVTVDIPVGGSIDSTPPPFEVGTRLLVSGDKPGPAANSIVAWGCGFTRYYDTATADSWRAATN
jgi:hypothetical protein